MGAPAVIGFITGKVLQKGTKEAIKKLGEGARAKKRLKTKTKEEKTISARKVILFKPSKEFKELVNKKDEI